MEPIKLTTKQAEFWEEFAADQDGAKAVLDRAFNFYVNRLAELRKQKEQWYREFRAIHNLDEDSRLRVKQENRAVMVVIADDED